MESFGYDINELIRELNRDYGINVNNRIIYLTGELYEELTLDDIIRRTDIIQEYSKRANINLPITWQISSYGGDVYEMFSIMDYMRLSPILINTHVIGKAMSAAAMLSVYGTGIRSATKYSTLMFHESSSIKHGKVSDQKANIKHEEALEEWVCEILAEKTKMSAKWWKTKQKTDLFFTPTEALDIGAIDKII